MMAFLFYAYYGNTNSQAVCGSGESTQNKSNGGTNSLGMTDTVAGGNGDSGSTNFWGLENWWGFVSEWMDDVSVNNRSWQATMIDGSIQSFTAPNEDGYISKIFVGDNLCVIPSSVGASESTGFCDYYAKDSGNGHVVARSCYLSNIFGGVVCVDSSYGSSYYHQYFGSRLAYHGDYVKVESSADFKSIT